MCLCLPVHDRCAMLPSPGRLNCAQCGLGHEHRVYLSGASVVRVITVLLWQGMDCKILGRRQLCHVTILQDYPFLCMRDSARLFIDLYTLLVTFSISNTHSYVWINVH